MTRLAVLVALGVAASGAAVAAAGTPHGAAAPAADGPSGVHITPLAQGVIGSRVRTTAEGIRIRTNGPRAILATTIVVDPGGSFGWHTHPGPVLVTMAKGTLTLFEAGKKGCNRATLSAGEAFIEDGGDVHLARNDGSEPVELNATFLARTGTTEFLRTVPRPAGCTH